MRIAIAIVTGIWFRALVWIIIGIGVNTMPPHYPTLSGNFGLGVELHSIVQYILSVMLWPLSLWAPAFTVGKWTGL